MAGSCPGSFTDGETAILADLEKVMASQRRIEESLFRSLLSSGPEKAPGEFLPSPEFGQEMSGQVELRRASPYLADTEDAENMRERPRHAFRSGGEGPISSAGLSAGSSLSAKSTTSKLTRSTSRSANRSEYKLSSCGLDTHAFLTRASCEDMDSVQAPERQVFALPPGWPKAVVCRITPELRMGHRMTDDDLSLVSQQLRHDQSSITKTGSQRIGQRISPSSKRCAFEVIHPNSKKRAIFDGISLVLLAMDAIIVPYLLAWDPLINGALEVVTWVTLVFWTLDIPLSFNTGIYIKGELQMKRGLICRHYVKTWFFLDFVPVACDWASRAMTHFEGAEVNYIKGFRIAKLGRVVRVVGLLRLIRRFYMLDQILERDSSGMLSTGLEVLKLFIAILWLNHCAACMWYAIGFSDSFRDTETSWVHYYLENNVEFTAAIDNIEPWSYTTSLHWALSQVTPGSMEVFPRNTVERIFAIFSLCAGMILMNSLVSKMSANMVRLQNQHDTQRKQIRALRVFLNESGVVPQTALRIQKQVLERMSQRQRLTMGDVEAMRHVSPALRARLLTEIHGPHLKRHPLFHTAFYLNSGTFEQLCDGCIVSVWAMSAEVLFTSGKEARQTYLVLSGELTYVQEPESSMTIEKTTARVAEGEWVCEAAMWCQWTHVGTMEAVSTCQLTAVSPEAMIAVVAKHQIVKELIIAYAERFHESVASASPPLAWPTDLSVPFADFAEVVGAMPRHLRTIVGQAALRHASAARWSHDNFELLEAELHSGRSIVVLNSDGGMERVVLIVTLRVVNLQGHVLMRLGRCKEGGKGVEPLCLLPGTKPQEGEEAVAAIQRALACELAAIHDRVVLGVVECQVQRDWSKRLGVNTRYLKVVQHARLEGTTAGSQTRESSRSLCANLCMDPPQPHHGWFASSRVRLSSGLSHMDLAEAGAFTMCSAGARSIRQVYLWLSEDEFAAFSVASGEQALSSVLSNVNWAELPSEEVRTSGEVEVHALAADVLEGAPLDAHEPSSCPKLTFGYGRLML